MNATNLTMEQRQKVEELGKTIKQTIAEFEKREGISIMGMAMEFWTACNSIYFPKIDDVKLNAFGPRRLERPICFGDDS